MPRATTSCNATDNMRRATGSVQHATENPVLCRQRGNDNRRRAPGNKHATKQETTRQHAACRQRATGSMQPTTCNRQQTACRRTTANARCSRRHTALPHFVCGGQRAAENQQHARSIVRDNQCATRHRRHTRCNTRPYDPCRSMQQTQTEPTTRSRKCNDDANEIQTLAHLRACCAGGGGVGWSVDSDCRRVTSRSSRATRKTGHSGTAEPTARNPTSQTRKSKVGCTERETEASETAGSRRSEGARVGSPQSARTACQRSSQPSH